MQDMLINLQNLENTDALCKKLAKMGITISRATASDLFAVLDFVEQTSDLKREGEALVCFNKKPATCFIATKAERIIGYCCYDASQKGCIGPIEVLKEYQRLGIGTALIVKALEDCKYQGYSYMIVKGVGPKDFYRKACGATLIKEKTK